MIAFAPLSPEEMARRHARGRAQTGKTASARPPRPRNVEVVLDLGNTMYFTFRGRAYGIPPLGWRGALKIREVLLSLPEAGQHFRRDTLADYRRTMARLPRLLWRHSHPVGLVRRSLRVLGLHRNPFADATETELLELADFFLQCRTKSSVGFPPTGTPPRKMSSTPSANSSGTTRPGAPRAASR